MGTGEQAAVLLRCRAAPFLYARQLAGHLHAACHCATAVANLEWLNIPILVSMASDCRHEKPYCLLWCSSPAVDAEPTGPTSGEVSITPPAGGPYPYYEVTLCPVGGPASECVTTRCTTPAACPVSGLTPETTYVATASIPCVTGMACAWYGRRCGYLHSRSQLIRALWHTG